VIAALEIEDADHDQHDARVVAHKIGRLDPPPPTQPDRAVLPSVRQDQKRQSTHKNSTPH
jgi:hypothetical protein